MFKIRLAEVVIAIENRYNYIERQCVGYTVSEDTPADFTVSVSEETIDSEVAQSPDVEHFHDVRGYAESVCAYRMICMRMPDYDAFLFHSVALAVDGKCYLFSAPSGTGKSTHLRLWMREYGERVNIINGDKPILRYKDGVFTVYGTPWSGKEGWHTNSSAPLCGICFLARGTENSIEKLSAKQAADRTFKQILYPKEPTRLLRMLQLADILVTNTPIYLLHCTISCEAARMAYRTMVGKD